MVRENIIVSAEFLQTCPLILEDDLTDARAAIKMHAADLGFSVMNQTRIVTASSELGRNVIEHGLGGQVLIEKVSSFDGIGIRLSFRDSGPGIDNMELALTDGYTSKKGLGLGLTGSKRLMDDFKIESEPNKGTAVTVVKWK